MHDVLSSLRSLRVLIPLVVMLSFAAVSVTSLLDGLHSRRMKMLDYARSDSRLVVSRLVMLAEQDAMQEHGLLEAETARLATDPRNVTAAVFGRDGVIVAASVPAWVGQRVSRLPSYALARFESARQTRMVTLADAAEGRVIMAMMSYPLPPRPNELRGLERGVAYVAYDLTAALREESRQEIGEHLAPFLVSLLVAVALSYLLQKLVTLPLRRLEQASRALAAGEFESDLEIAGVTEIRGLGTSFKRMRKQLAERIAEAERFALRDELLDSLGEGVCGLDAQGCCTFINPAALAMLGWDAVQVVDRHRMQVFRCRQSGCEAYRTDSCPVDLTLADGQRRERDETFVDGQGRHFPVHLTVTPIRCDGNITGTVLAFQDISERKQSERALAESEAKYRRLHESMNDAYAMTDMSGRILDSNRAFQALLGYTAEELGRLTYIDLTPACWHLEEARIIAEEVLPHGYSGVYEKEYRRRDGVVFPVELRIFLLRDDQGVASAMWAIVRDITERKRFEAELHRLATTDPLIGVANRRHFLGQMGQELARLKRYGETAALLILDVDHFKQVNDRHGHAAGDVVLCHLAALAQSLLRRSDLFGCLGGEEFGILLPATHAVGAVEFAERLRLYISENPAKVDQADICCTVSIGLTEFSMKDEHPDQILARADSALYRAKELGRNRVEWTARSASV